MNFKKIVQNYRLPITIILLIVASALAILLLYNNHCLNKETNDFISGLKEIITVIALLIGGALSYMRFFMGRTLSAKADIEFDVILIETPYKSILHTVKFALLNKGNMTIYDPIANVRIDLFGKETKDESLERKELKEYTRFKHRRKRNMVDVSEKAFFLVSEVFDSTIWAVRYSVEVIGSNGQIWRNTITVANKIEEDKSKS